MLKIFRMLLGEGNRPPPNKTNVPQDSAWLSWKSESYPPSAPSGFVNLTGATDVSVAGTSYRLADCKVVISALRDNRASPTSITLVREDANDEHKDAIGVIFNLRHRKCHIGYLPRDVADRIAHEFTSEMPLEAALREWGQKKSGDAVFFKLCVFVPNAKDRKKFSRRME